MATLEEVLTEREDPLEELEREFNKPQKRKRKHGGNNERNSLLRVQLKTFEQLLRNQRRIERKIDETLTRLEK